MVDVLTLNAGAFLAVAMFALAALLLVVSLVSYRRLGRVRLLIVGLAFAVLAVKGALAASAALLDGRVDLVASGLDFAVLALLYVSVAKR